MTQIKGFSELANCLVGKAMSKDLALSNKAKSLELDKAIHVTNVKESGKMLANMAQMVLTLPAGKGEEDRLSDGILWPKGRNYRDEAKSSLIASFKRWSKDKEGFVGKSLKWDNEAKGFTFKEVVESSPLTKLEKIFPGLDHAHYTSIVRLADECKAQITKSVADNRAAVESYRIKQALLEDYSLLIARGETVETAVKKAALMNDKAVEDVKEAIGQ